MAAYTDAAKIAAYLGVTLTSPQQAQAAIVAQAASDWIDQYKGRSWQIASPVTDERHEILGDRLYLNNRPVTAVSAVKTRSYYPDLGVTTLDAGQYELLDGPNGLLVISGWSRSGVLALVSYTHTATANVPSTIALAATLIAASWMAPTLSPQTAGVSQIAVGQNDINVKFSEQRGDVPKEALTLLGSRAIVVA